MTRLAPFALLAIAAAAPPPAYVTVDQLASAPAKWEGRRVRLEGLAVREVENYRLYAHYEDYCASEAGRHGAIRVDWPRSLAAPTHFRRMAVVEGIFHDPPLPSSEAGRIVVAAKTAPGPLEDVRVVRWTSGDLPGCGDPHEKAERARPTRS